MPNVIHGINCAAIYTEILFSLVDVDEKVGLIFWVSNLGNCITAMRAEPTQPKNNLILYPAVENSMTNFLFVASHYLIIFI